MRGWRYDADRYWEAVGLMRRLFDHYCSGPLPLEYRERVWAAYLRSVQRMYRRAGLA